MFFMSTTIHLAGIHFIFISYFYFYFFNFCIFLYDERIILCTSAIVTSISIAVYICDSYLVNKHKIPIVIISIIHSYDMVIDVII